MVMRLFYTPLPKFLQCQGCSRSVLSGMCPVRTHTAAPPPPLFSQVFILKVVKVLCFDTDLQVFILKQVSSAICPGFGRVLLLGDGPPCGLNAQKRRPFEAQDKQDRRTPQGASVGAIVGYSSFRTKELDFWVSCEVVAYF